jgi:hypothetical protein
MMEEMVLLLLATIPTYQKKYSRSTEEFSLTQSQLELLKYKSKSGVLAVQEEQALMTITLEDQVVSLPQNFQ